MQNILDGYGHLIREAICSRAGNIRDDLYPDYFMGVNGIIISNKTVRLILYELEENMYSNILNNNFYFKASTCYENVDDKRVRCHACGQKLSCLQRRCSDTTRMRTEGVNKSKTNDKYLCNFSLFVKP